MPEDRVPSLGLPKNRLRQSVLATADKRQWRPISQRFTTLAATTLITLILLGLVVVLHYLDYRDGHVFATQDTGSLSPLTGFQVRYLPTILIVLYGMWISTIDLDVRRLEPWYQLSRDPQPHTSSPLLCTYDVDFVLTVMARAFLNR